MLLAVIVGAALRFWQLGDLPPGVYRDEAYTGLDALAVLRGEHALFFEANNGREPAYIYLTALAVALFGPTAFALRLGAALIGSVTTLFVYKLGRVWFSPLTGLLAAWLWAATLWPIHLSRIGLRAVWLPLVLTLFFWLATLAYQRRDGRLWLLAGAVYGAGFYTYLAIRFTPLLLAAILLYLIWRGKWDRLRGGLLWFGFGFGLVILPFAALIWRQPELFLGRSGQVSLFNPAIHGGDLLGTLLRQIGSALGLFFWQGDTILRHNPAGRPLLDWVMAGPFLLGVIWAARHWRRPSAAILLLWTAIMLGPTILAEDAPHFLRAVGVLPATLVFPAIGLSHLWTWSKLNLRIRRGLALFLLALSLTLTARDYTVYLQQPDTGYLFERAATEMAAQINNRDPETAVWLDQLFWDSWPSIRFLAHDAPLTRFAPAEGIVLSAERPSTIYAWPYAELGYIPAAAPSPSLIAVQWGGLSRGDLEPTPYPLYTRYDIFPGAVTGGGLANFDNQITLERVRVTAVTPTVLAITLDWAAAAPPRQPLIAFVHVISVEGLIGQDDSPPGQGGWPESWWRPSLQLREERYITMQTPHEPQTRQIFVGVYPLNEPTARLPIIAADGTVQGDLWQAVEP